MWQNQPPRPPGVAKRASLDASAAEGLPRYETLQPEYNLSDRAGFEGAVQDLCVAEDIGVIPYFSLAAGFLTGKYRSEADFGKSPRGGGMAKHLTPRGLRILGALDAVSARHRASQAAVALAWLMANPVVDAPIVGATKAHHLDDAIAAVDLELTDDEIERLTAPYTPHDVVGFQ